MSRTSKITVPYVDKMYFGLRAVIIGSKQVGKKTIIRQLQIKTQQKEIIENRITLIDKVLNVDYIFDFIINPSNLRSFNDIICLILIYDITSEQSFEYIKEKYLNEFAENINLNFQFLLMVGNKQDIEEYREVQSSDLQAEKFATSNQMIFFEASAENNKNLDYVEKLLRVRSAQTMKKYNIKPTAIPPTTLVKNIYKKYVQIQEEQESQSQTQTEVEKDSLNEQSQDNSLVDSLPPSLPDRDDSEALQTPVKNLDSEEKQISSDIISKLLNDEQRPLPSVPKSSNEKTIISDIISKPIKSNLNAKFNSVAQSNSSKKNSQPSISKSEEIETQKKKSFQQLFQDCQDAVRSVDVEINQIKHEIQQIDEQIKKKNSSELNQFPFERIYFDRKNNSMVSNKIQSECLILEPDSFESRRRSPNLQSARLTIPEINSVMNKSMIIDSRRYSRKYKPILFIIFELEEKLISVEVYNDDTASTVAERIIPKLGKIGFNKKLRKRIANKIEQEISFLNDELEKQCSFIEKKRLRFEDAINNYMLQKNKIIQENLGTSICKNNWLNPNHAIAKIIVQVGCESKTLYIHQQDDPYELAFYFLLDNELEKNKIQILAEQIQQLKQSQQLDISMHQVTERSTAIKYIFQGNFDCGNGTILPLFIRNDDNIEKKVFQFVNQNKLKYEQYQRILKIVNKSINQ